MRAHVSQASYRVRIALNLKGIAREDSFLHLEKGDQFADAYLPTRPMLCFIRILARISILSNGSRREIAISTMASVAAYDRLGPDHRAEPTICSRLRTTGRSSAARRLYAAR